MSGQVHQRHNQGPKSNKVFNAYEQLQDIIREAGVDCSVVVLADRISIRTKDYADYVLARRAIRGRVSLEIVRDEN